jgi:hypothetical protein
MQMILAETCLRRLVSILPGQAERGCRGGAHLWGDIEYVSFFDRGYPLLKALAVCRGVTFGEDPAYEGNIPIAGTEWMG